jgi:hypothetical protein
MYYAKIKRDQREEEGNSWEKIHKKKNKINKNEHGPKYPELLRRWWKKQNEYF